MRVLVRVDCRDPKARQVLWDMSFLLVKARNEAEATRRAEVLARKAEVSYVGGTGHRVSWRFARVLEAYDPSVWSLSDGVEVYTRLKHVNRGRAWRDPLD